MIQMLSALETVGLVDREATLFLNYNGGMAQDVLWTAFSSKLVWIPLGVMFVWYLLTKNKGCQRNTILIILATALTVLLCDQISSSIIKPLAARLRPSHTPGLMTLLHYVDRYRGGLHGFCSSHAVNSFGVAMFVSLCVRRKYISFLLFLFSFVCRLFPYLSWCTLSWRCRLSCCFGHIDRLPSLAGALCLTGESPCLYGPVFWQFYFLIWKKVESAYNRNCKTCQK